MKWIGITLLLLVIGGGWSLLSSSKPSKVTQLELQQGEEQTDRSSKSVDRTSSSIFIPYWNIPSSSNNLSDYETLIYFGMAPNSQGNVIQDSGFKNIESFISNTDSSHERLLTVGMLDDEVSLALLEDEDAQFTLIDESIRLADEYEFDGLVLDLELGVIPFENVESSITQFVQKYTSEVTQVDMTFSMTMYGDVFYRARPYNMAALAPHLDQVYIMAYDFHKSRGEPGPNFPYGPIQTVRETKTPPEGTYPYNFRQMIADFTNVMSPKDMTVVFGMYGYDWTLGKQGLPLKPAVAVPLNEIDPGGAIIDPESKEKYIEFTDNEGYDHELWYEDEESANVKIEYLMEQGIGSVGYWVWGYY